MSARSLSQTFDNHATDNDSDADDSTNINHETPDVLARTSSVCLLNQLDAERKIKRVRGNLGSHEEEEGEIVSESGSTDANSSPLSKHKPTRLDFDDCEPKEPELPLTAVATTEDSLEEGEIPSAFEPNAKDFHIIS